MFQNLHFKSFLRFSSLLLVGLCISITNQALAKTQSKITLVDISTCSDLQNIAK